MNDKIYKVLLFIAALTMPIVCGASFMPSSLMPMKRLSISGSLSSLPLPSGAIPKVQNSTVRYLSLRVR